MHDRKASDNYRRIASSVIVCVSSEDFCIVIFYDAVKSTYPLCAAVNWSHNPFEFAGLVMALIIVVVWCARSQ